MPDNLRLAPHRVVNRGTDGVTLSFHAVRNYLALDPRFTGQPSLGRRPESAPYQRSSSNAPSDRNSCWPAMIRVCQGNNQ